MWVNRSAFHWNHQKTSHTPHLILIIIRPTKSAHIHSIVIIWKQRNCSSSIIIAYNNSWNHCEITYGTFYMCLSHTYVFIMGEPIKVKFFASSIAILILGFLSLMNSNSSSFFHQLTPFFLSIPYYYLNSLYKAHKISLLEYE